jgi:4-amino-4-deoxy-L-arabinose transferase-like glycosyltransferase
MTWETCRWPLILISLWMITLTGIHSIPLEDHEVLVLQTTREMESRGDWVMPSFNYEPRLKKPPFNYWATAILSRLDPFSENVQIWHGRFISLLAGLIMVLATYHAGKTLFDPTIGKLASLLLVGMQGYIYLSHSARPDFLYSAFCVLQLFAWMYAWKEEDDTARQRIYGWLGWGMAGLATLTKGPQGPAVFLVGVLVFLLCGSDRKRTLKVMRPFVGIAIFCLLVLPWWFLLQQRVAEMKVNLSETQLSGSLLHNLVSWEELIRFYYPLYLFYLMIPASLIFLFMIPRLWKLREKMSEPTKILLYASAAMLIIFTLGGHYRKHYLLQLLPVFSILIASAVRTAAFPRLQGMWKRGMMALLAVLAVLCLGLIIYGKGYASLLWIFLNMIPLWLLLRQEVKDSGWDDGLFSTQLLKASVGLVIILAGCIAYLPSGQNEWRRSEQSFSESIGKTMQPGDLIVYWQYSSLILPFYVKQPVTRFDEYAKLEAYFQENHDKHTIYAVVPKPEFSNFSVRFENAVQIIMENPHRPEKEFVFVKLTAVRNIQP